MSDTLTLNKLEKLIEVENKLRDEYGQQLDKKDEAIAKLNDDKASLELKLAELEGTVAKQLATITELGADAVDLGLVRDDKEAVRAVLVDALSRAPAVARIVRKNSLPFMLLRAMKIAGGLLRDGRCDVERRHQGAQAGGACGAREARGGDARLRRCHRGRAPER